MKVQFYVAIYSVLVVFLFLILSLLFDYVQNNPEIKNGMAIIHAGVENRRF
jgi:hypothetical protein